VSFTHRVLIMRRDSGDPFRPAASASTEMVVYFPDGCPATRPAGFPTPLGSARSAMYCQHADSVCPGCADSWVVSHLVSDPITVPATTPAALRFTWATERTNSFDEDL